MLGVREDGRLIKGGVIVRNVYKVIPCAGLSLGIARFQEYSFMIIPRSINDVHPCCDGVGIYMQRDV